MKGVIKPDELYTREALTEIAGFGADTFFKIDTSGIVTPLFVAHRMFYQGAEIIAWMQKTAAKGHRRIGSPDTPNPSAEKLANSVAALQKSQTKTAESISTN